MLRSICLFGYLLFIFFMFPLSFTNSIIMIYHSIVLNDLVIWFVASTQSVPISVPHRTVPGSLFITGLPTLLTHIDSLSSIDSILGFVSLSIVHLLALFLHILHRSHWCHLSLQLYRLLSESIILWFYFMIVALSFSSVLSLYTGNVSSQKHSDLKFVKHMPETQSRLIL